MGQVPGEVVAAAFGCFNPKVVVPARRGGWQIASREAILEARERGATAMLAAGPRRAARRPRRGSPSCCAAAADAAPWAGRPIYAGLRSLGFPGHPLGAMWRAADLLREHRGDSHVISWAVGGADAVEVLLLTEQWWGLPARAYTPTRGWSGADMDAGFERLHPSWADDRRRAADRRRAGVPGGDRGPHRRARTAGAGCARRRPGRAAGAPRRLVRGDHRRRLLPASGSPGSTTSAAARTSGPG